MKTYVSVYLSSEGAEPGEVIDAMKSLGAKVIVGPWDFEIDTEKESLLELLPRIHETLKGMRVMYRVTTLEQALVEDKNVIG